MAARIISFHNNKHHDEETVELPSFDDEDHQRRGRRRRHHHHPHQQRHETTNSTNPLAKRARIESCSRGGGVCDGTERREGEEDDEGMRGWMAITDKVTMDGAVVNLKRNDKQIPWLQLQIPMLEPYRHQRGGAHGRGVDDDSDSSSVVVVDDDNDGDDHAVDERQDTEQEETMTDVGDDFTASNTPGSFTKSSSAEYFDPSRDRKERVSTPKHGGDCDQDGMNSMGSENAVAAASDVGSACSNHTILRVGGTRDSYDAVAPAAESDAPYHMTESSVHPTSALSGCGSAWVLRLEASRSVSSMQTEASETVPSSLALDAYAATPPIGDHGITQTHAMPSSSSLSRVVLVPGPLEVPDREAGGAVPRGQCNSATIPRTDATLKAEDSALYPAERLESLVDRFETWSLTHVRPSSSLSSSSSSVSAVTSPSAPATAALSSSLSSQKKKQQQDEEQQKQKQAAAEFKRQVRATNRAMMRTLLRKSPPSISTASKPY